MFDGSYFRAYAHGLEDWERGYRARLYYYKSLRRALLRLKPDPVEVAEIGCGLGMFSYALLSARPQLVLRASDISDYAVSVAKQKLARFPNAHVQVVDGEDSGLARDSCDMVVSLDVIEHLHHPERMLGQVFQALKPGGVFLFTTPNGRSLGSRLKVHVPIGDRNAARDSPWVWSPHKDPTHVNIRNPEEWRRACSTAGLTLICDGSDGCWDTPYVPGVPLTLQRLLFNGSHRLLMRVSARLPWMLGENYVGFWRKP